MITNSESCLEYHLVSMPHRVHGGHWCVGADTKGSPPPPPRLCGTQDDVGVQVRVEISVPKEPEKFFRSPRRGVKPSFNPCVCTPKAQMFVETLNMGENMQKSLPPPPWPDPNPWASGPSFCLDKGDPTPFGLDGVTPMWEDTTSAP